METLSSVHVYKNVPNYWTTPSGLLCEAMHTKLMVKSVQRLGAVHSCLHRMANMLTEKVLEKGKKTLREERYLLNKIQKSRTEEESSERAA